MSDLHIFNTQSPELVNREFAEFIRRCDLILEHVFHKPFDLRDTFKRWIEELKFMGDDAILILHDDPLYVTARYAGIDPHAVHTGIMDREYADLARRMHW